MAHNGSPFHQTSQFHHLQQPQQVPQAFGTPPRYAQHQSQNYTGPVQDYPQQYWQQYPQRHFSQPHSQYPQVCVQPQTQSFPAQNASPHAHAQAQSHFSSQQYQGPSFQHGGGPVLTNQETCYNCGLPDHFAQNCPEPRREVPAGQIKRQKRYHSNRVPSHQSNFNIPNIQPGLGPHQFFYSQPGPNQHQHPYIVNNNQSTPTPSPQQWHGPPFQQIASTQNHPPFQHNRFQPQVHDHHSSPPPNQGPYYGSPSIPADQTKIIPQGQHHGSLLDPITPHAQANSEPQQTHPTDLRGSGPEDDTFPKGPSNADKEQFSEEGEADLFEEGEVDDLGGLDLPDVPTGTKAYGEAAIGLVSRALPSNFVVADALYPIAPPAPEDEGRCLSRYFLDITQDSPLEDIHTSSQWKERLEDPILQGFTGDDRVVSLQICLARIKERQMPSIEEAQLQKSRSQSQSLAPRSAQATEMAQSLETLERALADAKAKQAEMIANKLKGKSISNKANKQYSPHNDNCNDRQPPPHDDIYEQQSKKDNILDKAEAKPIRTPSQESTPGPGSDRGVHKPSEDRLRKNRPPSESHEHHNRYAPKETHSHRSHHSHYQISHRGAPPPPPPPSHFKSAQGSRTTESQTNGIKTATRPSNNGHVLPSPDSDMSPTNHFQEFTRNRKRSHEHHEESSSEDEDDSPKRQQDDITPKYKRRQPKVAAAYSRRW